MIDRRGFGIAAGAAMALFIFGSSVGQAADPIRVGDLNSYTRLPAFTLPYRNGWQLALEQINASGGVLGRQIEVISKDDGATPGDAVTVANDLIAKENVSVLFGTLLSNVGLAVSDFARQRKTPFIAAEPLTDTIAWSKGNRYTFRLRPGTYVQAAMLAEEAAKLPAKRWATVAPNYEYGKSAVKAFKDLLSEKRPDIEWVEEQWPPLFKIDAGATAQAIARSEPDAIFNVTFGSDLAKFVREGRLRGLFDGREVASVLGGEPEWIDSLKDEAPEGWIVTGYPWYAIDSKAHSEFKTAYMKRFDDYPRMGSVVGFATMMTVAAAIREAGSTEAEAFVDAMHGLEVESPVGTITFRKADQQSTMGAYVGRLTVKDGMPRMSGWRYGNGSDYLPSESDAAKMRPTS